ncbi:MAG: hypothetical protein IRY86_07110 [Thermorudis peleae]|nr:hypothetical protein [Thermorudis peleae]
MVYQVLGVSLATREVDPPGGMMLCPFCGTEQSIASHCRACGAPLVTTAHPAHPVARRWERQSRTGYRVIGCFATLVTAAILLLALAALLSGRFLPPPATATPATTAVAGARTPTMATPRAASVAPSATPVPGVSQVVITEAQLNQELAAHADRLGPARSPHAVIDPSGVTISFTFSGLGARFHARPIAQDGSIVLVDSSLSGPLGFAVDADAIAQMLADALQQELAARQLRVDDVVCQPGQIVVTVSPAR